MSKEDFAVGLLDSLPLVLARGLWTTFFFDKNFSLALDLVEDMLRISDTEEPNEGLLPFMILSFINSWSRFSDLGRWYLSTDDRISGPHRKWPSSGLLVKCSIFLCLLRSLSWYKLSFRSSTFLSSHIISSCTIASSSRSTWIWITHSSLRSFIYSRTIVIIVVLWFALTWGGTESDEQRLGSEEIGPWSAKRKILFSACSSFSSASSILTCTKYWHAIYCLIFFEFGLLEF